VSLGATAKNFVAHEQADNAELIADGIKYHCKVYLNTATWAVEAVCKRVQTDGRTIVFHNIVERASAEEIEDTNGLPLDCPKIIAVGTTFVVHWLQATEMLDPATDRAWMLYRATMDMESFDAATWNNRGAVALLESHILYDVAPVIGSDTDFVVTRLVALDDIACARYDGFDWIDTVWAVNPGSQEVAPRVLGIHAHDDDNDVVISYQRNATGQLWSLRIDADTGGNEAGPVITFNDFVASFGEDPYYTQWVELGYWRTGANRVAVIAECRGAESEAAGDAYFGLHWVHHVCKRRINSASSARVGNEHWAANLHMLSRPWGYSNGTAAAGTTLDLYCCLGYRSIVEAQEWSQAYGFVCNLDLALWDTVASGPGLRPRPVATYWTLGVPDVRAGGWKPQGSTPDAVHFGPAKRMNHLSYAASAPMLGPDVKTRTVALVAYATIGTQSDDDIVSSDIVESQVAPERAIVGEWVVYIEDPWTLHRDDSAPEQPVENFAFPYARAMHQCVPAGKGMFVGGGTPQMYDGKQMVECGFPWKLEIIGAIGTDTGDLTALATYSAYAVPSWPDAQGQMHRGGPSNVITVELAGAQQSITMAVRCINISLKDADAFYPLTHPISIEVFLTTGDGVEFFRYFGSASAADAFAVMNTPANQPERTVGATTMVLSITDAQLALQGSGPFQTDTNGLFPAAQALGGTPPACTIPAMDVVANYQNRIWGASAIDPAVLWYSDEIAPVGSDFYQAPVFTTAQVFRIGEIGEVTGMHAMGSGLVVFTRSSIHVLNASDAGGGLLSVTSHVVHEDVGCVDPRTVALFYAGLCFQSQRGFTVLGRDFQLGYGDLARTRDAAISRGGAAIEDDIREAGNVRAASVVEDQHQILLATNGRPLVTQTWTGTVVTDIGGAPAGTWTINGLAEPISHVTTGPGLTVGSTIASALESEVDEAIAADAPDTLQFQVASADSPGATIVVVLLPGETATLSSTAPVGNGGNAINWVLTEELTTQPRVLAWDTRFQQWSRWDLVQTSSNPRLSEVVSATVWRGDGGSCHVVATQGALLIQRQPDDALAYADETSVANVGIPLDLTWAWWKLAGIVGAQRLWEATVQTTRYNQAQVFATLEYDRDGTFDGEQIQPTAYTWPRTGETATPSRLPVKPRHQRAGAHRLRLYESVGVTTARTFSVTAITLHVGVESGRQKVRAATRGEV
jgi:hypothetical protein